MNKYLYLIYLSIKSDFNRDKVGLIFHIFFPIIISVAVTYLWGNKNISGPSIALGFVAWDFFSRLLLDGSKFYLKYELIVNTDLNYIQLMLINIFTIISKCILTVIFILFFYKIYLNINFLFFLVIIIPIALIIFWIAIIFTCLADFLGGVITIYSRIGLYISPIFWFTENNLILLNPSTWLIDIFRYIISDSTWFKYDEILLFFLLCSLTAILFFCLMLEITKILIFKKYIRMV